jgi:hypothetical protein
MPIYINSEADATQPVSGNLPIVMDSFTTSFVGDASVIPDIDGSFNRALDEFIVSFNESGGPGDYPFLTTTFAIGWGIQRMTADPPKTIIAMSTWFVKQILAINNDAQRQSQTDAFDDLRAINPQCRFINHIDHHRIQIDAPGAGGDDFMEDLLYADSPNVGVNVWIRELNNVWQSRATSKDSLGFGWNAPTSVMKVIMDETYDRWSGGGVSSYNMMDYDIEIMHDTLSLYGAASNVRPKYFTRSSKGSPSSTEIDVPTWVSPPVSGPTDSNGYQTAFDWPMWVIVIKGDGTNGDEGELTGIKPIASGGTRLRIGSSVKFSMTGTHYVMVRRTAAEARGSGSEVEQGYEYEGWTRMAGEFNERHLALAGKKLGFYHNGAGKTSTDKFRLGQQGKDIPFGFPYAIGTAEGMQWEHAEEGLGFHCADSAEYISGTGEYLYKTKRTSPPLNRSQDYDADDMCHAIASVRPILKSPADSAHGYPCIWMNVNVRSFGSPNGNVAAYETSVPGSAYVNLDEVDHAFVLFWSCYCWSCEQVCPNPEVRPAHDMPVMIDEMRINAGTPITARDFWENYDPDGDSGKGTFDWKTPDFGTHGYLFEFTNCIIQINLRPPTDLNDLWKPSWLPDGNTIVTATDRATLPDLSSQGLKLQAFNGQAYVNDASRSPHFGKLRTFYETYPGAILKNDTLNDGSDRGATFDTGPLEAVIHMKVPI